MFTCLLPGVTSHLAISPMTSHSIRAVPLTPVFARAQRWLAALMLAPALCGAQGIVTIAAGTGPSVLVAPGAKVTVPIRLDMAAAAGGNLASLSTALGWAGSQLTLDSVKTAGFGTLTSNIMPGSASLAVFDANGTTTTLAVADLYFTAAAVPGATQVQVFPLQAGDALGADIGAQLRGRNVDVCIAPVGKWGDTNNDTTVNVIDAQQVARFSVGLSVLSPTAMAALGDVTADGAVNVIDAQQIARFSVALSAAPRIPLPAPIVAAVASMSVSATATTVGVGRSTQLGATPLDGSGTMLSGCQPVTWSSSSPGTATVTADGVVTGVASGSATITAVSGGQTASAGMIIQLPVAAITLAADTATIHAGEPFQLAATTRDGAGNPLLGRAIAYSSSDPTIASVSNAGLVTSHTAGLVTITLASEQRTKTAAIQVSPLAANALAMGDNFGCALDVKGDAYCWGSNGSGQLGNGTSTGSTVPVKVATSEPLVFTQIRATGSRVCAVTNRHRVFCWGAESDGSSQSVSPVLLGGAPQVKELGVGSGFGCMLDLAGAAFCTGKGTNGRLGTGDTLSTLVPRAVVGGLTFQAVSSGLVSSCGLQSSGTAYCWGDNSLRTLGAAGTPAFVLVPTVVTGGLTFTSLRSAAVLACGVVTNGDAYCWGTNYFGSTGTGSVAAGAAQATPTLVTGGIAFASVSPGIGNNVHDPVCGLAPDGTAYCWGSNSSGQLGTSVTPASSCTFGTQTFGCTGTPMAVTTTSKFNALLVGSEQVCGITTTRTLLCWGKNDQGQLGDGSTTNRSTPVAVSGTLKLP